MSILIYLKRWRKSFLDAYKQLFLKRTYRKSQKKDAACNTQYLKHEFFSETLESIDLLTVSFYAITTSFYFSVSSICQRLWCYLTDYRQV